MSDLSELWDFYLQALRLALCVGVVLAAILANKLDAQVGIGIMLGVLFPSAYMLKTFGVKL